MSSRGREVRDRVTRLSPVSQRGLASKVLVRPINTLSEPIPRPHSGGLRKLPANC